MLLTYILTVSVLAVFAAVRSRVTRDPLHVGYGLCAVSIGGLLVALAPSDAVPKMIEAGLLAALAVCAWTDASSGYIYDVVLAVAAVLVGVQTILGGHVRESLEAAAVAFVLAFGAHGLSRGRGLGFGDVKLFALTGAALGSIPLAVEAFGGSFVVGACVLVPAVALKRVDRHQKVAFAPFIAVATAAVLHYGVAAI